MSVGNADSYFTEECLADKWYKVNLTQTKEENNSCTSKAWWQGELVLNKNVDCQTNDNNMKLYISGNDVNVDGQVKNFSYVKK